MKKTRKEILEEMYNQLLYSIIATEIEIELSTKKKLTDVMQVKVRQTPMGPISENYTVANYIKDKEKSIKNLKNSLKLVKRKIKAL
jgi:hypothetical protein